MKSSDRSMVPLTSAALAALAEGPPGRIVALPAPVTPVLAAAFAMATLSASAPASMHASASMIRVRKCAETGAGASAAALEWNERLHCESDRSSCRVRLGRDAIDLVG